MNLNMNQMCDHHAKNPGMNRQPATRPRIVLPAHSSVLIGIIIFCMTACIANAQPSGKKLPGSDETNDAIVRSLAYLEKGGTGWLESQGCAGCHHAPMMIWSLNEAHSRGFKVNQKAIETVQTHAFDEYLKSPTLKPHPQDTGGENGLSYNIIALTLASESSGVQPDGREGKTKQALDKFLTHLIATQNSDGSWKKSSRTPPLIDSDEIVTLWSAFALDFACKDRPAGDPVVQSRNRAFTWAAAHQTGEETQALAVRLLLAVRTHAAETINTRTQTLLAKQRPDGGWSQTAERSSDCIATGMALYALSQAGITSANPSIPRAWSFLLKTQQPDGSWQVHTRGSGMHDSVISYYGSGWATLGLLYTQPVLPPAQYVPACIMFTYRYLSPKILDHLYIPVLEQIQTSRFYP